jgi:hypothetical protein
VVGAKPKVEAKPNDDFSITWNAPILTDLGINKQLVLDKFNADGPTSSGMERVTRFFASCHEWHFGHPHGHLEHQGICPPRPCLAKAQEGLFEQASRASEYRLLARDPW